AFLGETRVSTLAAVVNSEPRPAREVAEIPPELDRTITRCLRKDPARRFQNMADLHVQLLELKEESDSGRLSNVSGVHAAIPARPKRNRWLWPGVAVAAILATVAGWWAWRK